MKKFFLLLSIVCIEQIHGQIINTIAGNGIGGFSGDGGLATSAEIIYPRGVVLDNIGNLYIVEGSRIRKVDTSGIITTVAGNANSGYFGDGVQATSTSLNGQNGVAIDGFGNLYIADAMNWRIRKVDVSGIITTFAGNGTGGYSGDGGLAINAQLGFTQGLTFDSFGNLFLADLGNNCIRKINTSGIITTVAGNGTSGFSGDGGLATNAELVNPSDITFDSAGSMYIADLGNQRIRKVDISGIISTVAGNGIAGFNGDGGQALLAELNNPIGVAVDGLGNLFIADQVNHRIRMVDASGIITTVAGSGTQGFSGDGGLSASAELNGPTHVTLDISGNLYIADKDNSRVRLVCSGNNLRRSESTAGHSFCITNAIKENYYSNNSFIYPNPTSDQFFIETNTNEKLNVDLYDINGRHVFNKSVSDKSNIDVTTLSAGVYTLTIKNTDRVVNKKLVILR